MRAGIGISQGCGKAVGETAATARPVISDTLRTSDSGREAIRRETKYISRGEQRVDTRNIHKGQNGPDRFGLNKELSPI